MAKTVKKAARVETAYGQNLASPVDFTYEYEQLEKGDEIPAKEMPDDEDLRSYVNQKRNATERSKAQALALKNAGIEKPTLEDPQEQFKQMVNILMKSGQSKDMAETIATNSLPQYRAWLESQKSGEEVTA